LIRKRSNLQKKKTPLRTGQVKHKLCISRFRGASANLKITGVLVTQRYQEEKGISKRMQGALPEF